MRVRVWARSAWRGVGRIHYKSVLARVLLEEPVDGALNALTSADGRRPVNGTLRIANTWLRERGVEAGEARGNPLHRLRKQFGSEVATAFGLFNAQKLLGHSSPTTTAKYYAAQTNLPELTHVKIMG